MITEVIKRDGTRQPFDPAKIESAIYRCLVNGRGFNEADAESGAEDVSWRVRRALTRYKDQTTISIEEVQDVVEQQLAGWDFDAARAYILYREEHARARTLVPIDPQDQARVDANKQYFPQPHQELQFYDKYSRFDWGLGRRQTWEETIDRVITFFIEEVGHERLTPQEWNMLHTGMLAMDVMPSMRVLQMAGEPLHRCNVGAYNCAYTPIDSIQKFGEILYVLMQGTGCGFSVEDHYVAELPRVRYQKGGHAGTFTIPDTTHGWCDALVQGLSHWFNGWDLDFDYSLIRPEGSVLRTKGGRASGPEPLRALLNTARSLILAHQGSYLKPYDVHRIACMEGKIVQVGGVRRAAMIGLSDISERDIRDAKQPGFWNDPERAMLDMANNSVAYDEKPSELQFMREWMALVENGSGERGIFNRCGAYRQMPTRRAGYVGPGEALPPFWDRILFGTNPCGEILLRPDQFCNLSIAPIRETDDFARIEHKVRLAALVGTLQSLLTRFDYLSDSWRKNCEEERLLGVDLAGQMEHREFRPGATGRALRLRYLRDVVNNTNTYYSDKWGINRSSATTCCKPGGNSGEFIECYPTMRPREGKQYCRRFRIGAFTPVAKLLIDEGVPYFPDNGEDPAHPSKLVFEFPVKSPEDAVLKDDLTAIEHLNYWLETKENWTEHNPSCTIYVDEGEWLAVGQWCWEHFDQIGGLTFFPKNKFSYNLLPVEAISQEEYDQRVAAFPKINWAKLIRYEHTDETTVASELACTSGECMLT
jgi:ribonucleoside-triphosphate reductase (thioredoxin)